MPFPPFSAANAFDALQRAPLDPAVGIRLAPLAGNDEFALYAAEIAPRRRVGAHLHSHGQEIYLVLEGAGTLHLGVPSENGQTHWNASIPVQSGDCFVVHPGQVHQLANDRDQRLVAIFGCPKSHLSTDRILVQGFAESSP